MVCMCENTKKKKTSKQRVIKTRGKKINIQNHYTLCALSHSLTLLMYVCVFFCIRCVGAEACEITFHSLLVAISI